MIDFDVVVIGSGAAIHSAKPPIICDTISMYRSFDWR